MKLKLFNVIFNYNEDVRKLLIVATSKEEAIEMFKLWIPIHKRIQIRFHNSRPDIKYISIKNVRKNKKNSKYFSEEYYQKELRFLGMENKQWKKNN